MVRQAAVLAVLLAAAVRDARTRTVPNAYPVMAAACCLIPPVTASPGGVVAALPLFVAAFFWGDSLLGFLFGGRWADSGYYLRCLLPWVYVMLTSSSLMFMSSVFGRQRTEFGFYLVLLLLRVVAVVVGICSGNFRLAILLFSMAGMAVSAALLVWYFRLMAHYENKEV